MPGDPKECREHAKHCQEMADTAQSQFQRVHFEHLAQTWTRLANDLERGKALLEHWGNPNTRKTG